MGADNWAVCPRCMAKAQEKQQKLQKKVESSYGKVPAEKLLEMVREAAEPVQMQNTLREDYEIGTGPDGVLEVVYRCSCSGCDFHHEHRHEEQLKV